MQNNKFKHAKTFLFRSEYSIQVNIFKAVDINDTFIIMKLEDSITLDLIIFISIMFTIYN